MADIWNWARGFHTLILEEDGRPSIQTNPSYSTLK